MQSSDRKDENHYNLIMEEYLDKEMDNLLRKTFSAYGIYVSKILKKLGTTFFSDLYISTKSKSVLTFDLDVIIDSPKNHNNFKKPTTDNFSSFRALFLSRKLAKIDLTDNNLLLQLMEKINTLSKIIIKQSKHIKQLENKIDSLTKTDMKAGLGLGTST